MRFRVEPAGLPADGTPYLTHRPLLNNIQCLRAVAAYMVVLYHARLFAPVGARWSFEFGNAGVDIFFIISGFIINHVGARADVGAPGAFLMKRAIRIVPLYWLLTLLVGTAVHVVPSLVGIGGPPDAARMIRSLLFIPYVDDAGEMHPVLFMGWTLNYEMFFYVSFAAALMIRAEPVRLWVLTGALVALVAIGVLTDPQQAPGKTYTSPLLLEFVVGLWMNRMWRAWRPASLPRSFAIAAGAAMVVAVGLLAIGDHAWPDAPRVLKWGVPAGVIVAGALALERGGRALRWPWLLLMGEASFAIYLIHPFVIKAVTIVHARLGVTTPPLPVLALLLVLASVGLVGIAFHLLVERPLIRWLRHLLLPRAAGAAVTADLPADSCARGQNSLSRQGTNYPE